MIVSICVLLLTACGNKKKLNNNLAKNYYQQSLVAAEKNKREALALVDKSIKIDPTPRAYALKATLLYQIGDYRESLKLFEKVIHERAASVHLKTDVSNNYACNLLVLGQTEKAKQTWFDLTNNRHYLSPEVAWFNLGLLEYSLVPEKKNLTPKEKNQLQAAEQYFRKAVKINQDYIDSYYYLVLTLIRLERLAEAKQTLIQVIGIMPEHQNAQNLLLLINKLEKQAAQKPKPAAKKK